MKTCLLLSSDLIFSSRIQQAANHADVECVIARNEDSLSASLDLAPFLVFIDLESCGEKSRASIQAIKQALPNARIIAFGPHVQADLLQAATEAGADLVLARSAFVQQLSSLLTQ